MNDLNLPPRRTLPPEAHDRILARVHDPAPTGRTVRYRAPLSVAAGVAVLAIGAVIVGQSTAGTPDGYRAGTTPSSSTTAPPGNETASATAVPPTSTNPPAPPLAVTAPDAQTQADLDRCGAAVAASPRAHEFAPRAQWVPVFTASRHEGVPVRVIAFREGGGTGKPGFCEIAPSSGSTAPTAVTVSDPSAEPMSLAMEDGADIYALYLSPTGIMAGVAQGVTSVEFGVTNVDPTTGKDEHSQRTPVFRDELFVIDVGGLTHGSAVDVTGIGATGDELAQGRWEWAEDRVRPVGASGQF